MQQEHIIELSRRVGQLADRKISSINRVTRETKILALNALIEASRAGQAGVAFAVVAGEVKSISERITDISVELSNEMAVSIGELNQFGEKMIHQIHHARGQRLTDLALNMIEIIDRNLYERSCDVRWWATDTAVVEVLEHADYEGKLRRSGESRGDTLIQHACRRLSVILGSYTVYIDLWVADANGRVVANGRPKEYPGVIGSSVANQEWFKTAMQTKSGEDFVALDVESAPLLGGKPVATYATAVRAGGLADGKVIGALGIFFDWGPQAAAVTYGVRLSEEERSTTRCMLLDARHRVIASSDGKGLLQEVFELNTRDQKAGFYPVGKDRLVGFSLTPGYETYKGLGWYGVIEQRIDGD